MAQATAQTGYDNRWQEITTIWKDNRWLYIIAGLLLGILVTPALEQITGNLNELIGNLVPEAIGIVFTVLILDRLASNRATEELKKRLVREAGSQSNETAKAAIDWMRAEGWLTIDDDIQLLKGANLSEANLEGANLRYAHLQDSYLFMANLQSARLRFANLQGANLQAAYLEGADLRDTNLEGANLELGNLKGASFGGANFDEKTILPNIKVQWDDNGKAVPTPESYWIPKTDMTRYTDPKHPDFWQPWVKKQDK